MSKLTLRAQTVDIAYLPLRQDLLAKTVLMTAQRDFQLGNSLWNRYLSKVQPIWKGSNNSPLFTDSHSGCRVLDSGPKTALKITTHKRANPYEAPAMHTLAKVGPIGYITDNPDKPHLACINRPSFRRLNYPSAHIIFSILKKQLLRQPNKNTALW